MSNQSPNTPRPRRRVAGERKTARPDPSGATTPEETSAAPAAPAPSQVVAGRGVPIPVIVALGVLLLALVVLISWGATIPGVGIPAWKSVRDHDAVARTERTAPSAAERAAVAILSYDYTSLDADKKSAARYMTRSYKKQYVDTFDSLVKGNAPKLKAKVVAQVVASGVSHADPDRAEVLLFVDQTTTSTANGGEPQVALNRVMFDLVNRDGTWLVNDITSY